MLAGSAFSLCSPTKTPSSGPAAALRARDAPARIPIPIDPGMPVPPRKGACRAGPPRKNRHATGSLRHRVSPSQLVSGIGVQHVARHDCHSQASRHGMLERLVAAQFHANHGDKGHAREVSLDPQARPGTRLAHDGALTTQTFQRYRSFASECVAAAATTSGLSRNGVLSMSMSSGGSVMM